VRLFVKSQPLLKRYKASALDPARALKGTTMVRDKWFDLVEQARGCDACVVPRPVPRPMPRPMPRGS